MMRKFLLPLCALTAPMIAAEPAPVTSGPRVILVAGAVGDPEFAPDFDAQLTAWARTGREAAARFSVIGREGEGTAPDDRERLRDALSAEPKDGVEELWIVLVGHGTFDGREAKLNLRGPDVAAAELADWLKPFTRPVAVVHTTSSSAPFIAKLAAPDASSSARRAAATSRITRVSESISPRRWPTGRATSTGTARSRSSSLSSARRTARPSSTRRRGASRPSTL